MQDIVLIKVGMKDPRTENGDREYRHINNTKAVDFTFLEFKEMKKCLNSSTNDTSKFTYFPILG